MKRKAGQVDADYVPPQSASKEGDSDERFLNQHRAFILKMHAAGEKPKTIAAAVRKKANLRDEAIKPKDISNWLQYNKNKGVTKTRKVTKKNNNLEVDDADCMFPAPGIYSPFRV
jgi:hypothetical protein